jgi:hypothetical protein
MPVLLAGWVHALLAGQFPPLLTGKYMRCYLGTWAAGWTGVCPVGWAWTYLLTAWYHLCWLAGICSIRWAGTNGVGSSGDCYVIQAVRHSIAMGQVIGLAKDF